MAGSLTCATVLAAFWLLGIVFIIALCRAAKRGDRGLTRASRHAEMRRLRGY